MRRRALLGLAAAAGLAPLPAGSAAQRRPSGPHGRQDVPPPLRPGSRIVAVAPGTWWESPADEIQRLRQRCQAEGWLLEVPRATTGRWRWFSGTDTGRRLELDRAWADPAVGAIFCVAGGWGSARILEMGWHPPARPLWLVGFSDTSALLLAQLAAGTGGGVHASTGGDPLQWQRLVRLLRREPLEPLQGQGWVGGAASGPLVVTNLTVATALIGTPWFPSLAGCVLVLEDVGEAPYRVDRMLTQWRTAGVLRGVAAVGVGRFSWQQDDILPGDFSLEEVLRERLGSLVVPLVGRLPVGHGRPNLALPLGAQARLDGDSGVLTLL